MRWSEKRDREGPVLRRISYRLWQVWVALSARPLTAKEWQEVDTLLPPAARTLFAAMAISDQRHCLNVQQVLRAHGCDDRELLQAALLHDIGKGGRRVPFWVRPVIVLLKRLAPQVLAWLAGPYHPLYAPKGRSAYAVDVLSCVTGWRRPFYAAWYHAAIGADLAATAGLSPRVALLIRTHHQPDGPAAVLHAVDDEL
jgi:hypothetical protein